MVNKFAFGIAALLLGMGYRNPNMGMFQQKRTRRFVVFGNDFGVL